MIKSVAVLLALTMTGNAVSEALSAPVPGSALGLLLLAAFFAIRQGPDEGYERLFDIAAPYFPLFFVPAAVGIVATFDLLAASWLYVVEAVAAGTAITIAVTGMLAQSLLGRGGREVTNE